MRLFYWVLPLFIFFLFSTSLLAQSDGCSSATPISVTANCASPTNGTTTGATQTIPGCVGNADDDVWYTFVATATAHQINVTASASFDPVVQLFSGNCSTLISLVCRDNGGTGVSETINATGLTIGVSYTIRVYHYGVGSGSGNFTICVTNPPPAPANDNCGGAIGLVVNAACVYTNSTSVGATQSLPGCTGNADDDVWFSFVATNSVQTITVDPSSFMDPVVQLFSGTCGSLTSITCMDAGFTNGNEVINAIGLTPGQTYRIRVYDYYTGTGGAAFQICVSGSPTAVPTNDEPCNAIALPAVTSACNFLQFTSTGSTASMGAPTPASCAGGSSPFQGGFSATSHDVWFSVVVPASGQLVITAQPNYGLNDGVTALYSGTCGSLTQIACSDDYNYPGSTNDLKPYINATGLTPGTTVFIRYWGYGSSQGNFGLCVSAPANDACANALYICDLDGYSGSTSAAYTPDRPCNMFGNNETAAGVDQPNGVNTGGIFGQGGPWGTGSAFFDVNINNNSWIRFTASSTSATLTVNIFDCWIGNYPSGGIQMQIFSGTNCCSFVPVSNFEESSTGFVITANNLTPGQDYYLMIDGFAGDICNYTISANSGVQIGNITSPTDSLCFGQSTTLTAPGGSAGYVWQPGGQTTQSITVSPSTTTTYSCEVAGYCGERTTLTKTIIVSQPPSPSVPGPDQTICFTPGTTTMAATAPAIGTGTWTQVSGPSAATITNPNSPSSSISGLTTAGTYVFRWTISSGVCAPVSNTMTITVNPAPTTSNAGTATAVCVNTTGNLNANTPTNGTGTWTQQSGPAASTITNPNNPSTTVTGLSVAGTYVYQWSISNSPCVTLSTSTVSLVVNPLPTITVSGNPSLTICPSGSTVLTASGASTYTWSPATGLSATTGTSVTANPVSTSTYTISGTNSNGCVNTTTATVTVQDNTPPVISCPTNANVIVNGACSFTIPDYTTTVTATDNCASSPVITQSPVAGTILSGAGTTQVITLTANDGNGNTANCNFTITLTDNIAPSISCPGNQSASANASCQFTLADYTSLATVNDNCAAVGTITVSQSPAPGTLVSGTQTVTLTANDGNGNTANCTFQVVVNDNTPPTIAACVPNQTGSTNASCQFALGDYTSLLTASDNCTATGALTVTQTPLAGTLVGIGTTSVTVLVSDANGNSSSCSFDVVVSDQSGPSITCPGNQNLFLTGPCSAQLADYTSMATVSDNCTSSSSIVITQSPVAGTTISGNGTTQLVTLTATDANGNSSTCNFTVTAVDNTAPSITCPANQSVSSNALCQYTLADYTTLATVSDDCAAASSISVSQSPLAGTVLSGNQTITLTADDGNGNTATCTFDVIVSDTTAPSITACPNNQNVAANASCSYSLLDYTGLITVSDNCSATSSITINQNPVSGTVVQLGTTVVTLTATDQSGNSQTCTFSVIVSDSTAPTITCPANITTCNPLVSYVSPIGSDNCTGVITSQTDATGLSSGSIFPIGTTTLTYTTTDGASNAVSCSFTVTVNPSPSQSVVGPDVTVCDTVLSLAINGNTPGSGTGIWNVISGRGIVADPNLESTTVSGLTTGANVLTWTISTANCGSTSDTLIVTMEPCIELVIPTGFTPDGDGVNDVWVIQGLKELYPNNRVEVFNRWGGLLFRSDGSDTLWDGKYNNKRMPLGSYYFVIDLGDGSKPIKGTVTIIF